MKYTGSISIGDDNGDVVFERELSADEIIEALLSRRPEAEEVEESPEPAASKKKRKCGLCGKKGHSARKCPGAESVHDDPLAGQHREGKPCCGSVGPRHKKGCQAASGDTLVRAQINEKAELEALTEEQYEAVRTAMHDREFQSAQYSLVNKVPPREVNWAIRSDSYEHYLDGRV